MTLLISSATRKWITLTIDSAQTNTFEDGHVEYSTTWKAMQIRTIGVIGRWGDLAGPALGLWLDANGIYDGRKHVDDLEQLVEKYLFELLRPHESGNEVGFHVAGFDVHGNAKLYHLYYATKMGESNPAYDMTDHSPDKSTPLQLVYNGWNHLAEGIIKTLVEKQLQGGELNYDLSRPEDRVTLSRYMIEIAGNFCPEVGSPIRTYLISPHQITYNENIRPDQVRKLLTVRDVEFAEVNFHPIVRPSGTAWNAPIGYVSHQGGTATIFTSVSTCRKCGYQILFGNGPCYCCPNCGASLGNS
jgi:hypothetical protein